MIFHPALSVFLICAMGIGSFIATCFIWWLYSQDRARPRSWLLRMLATASTALMVGGWYLGWIAYIRITEGLHGVPEWTAPFTTLTVLVLGGTPIYFLVTFLRHSGFRRRR